MADNVQLSLPVGSGSVIATDDDGTAHHQYFKLEFGGDGTFTKVTSAVGLPVGDAGGSLTVDAPVGTPVFVRLSDGSAAISTLPVSLASVPSHAVTNAGMFAVQVDNTVTVAAHNVTNAGTFAVQATIASGATSIAHAEDDASANLDVGVGCLAVRKATPANTSGADGDYEFLQMSAGRLWVDASGKTLTVDGSGVTQPVSGTVAISGTVTVGSHAVTNAGTFATQETGAALTSLQLLDDAVSGAGFNISQMNGVNVSMGNGASGTGTQRVTIANDSTGTVAVTNTGTFAVQATISGTVTVGSHAVTNAGTFVVQINGAALTSLANIETNTNSGAVVGNGAAATAQRVTLASDSTGIVALTTSTASIGKLAANSGVDIGDVDILSIAAGDNNIGNVDIVTVPTDPFGANADAASATGSISAKLRFIASTGIPITGTVTVASHAVTNAGTFAVQATVAAGATTIGKAEDVASADADVGVPAMAVRKATPANTSGTDGDYEFLQMSVGRLWVSATVDAALPAGTALIGKVGIDQTTPGTTNAIQDIPGTSGGLSISSFLSTAAVQATAIKASAGQVYSLEFFNISATPVYVRLYNMTTTPGTGDTVVWRGIVPGNTAGAGFVKCWEKGLAFSTGIGMRCSAAIADNDATALTANTVIGNVEYK